MEKITLKEFKKNKVFIVLTLAGAVFVSASTLIEPAYPGFLAGLIITIIVFPFVAWWFQHFWNEILVRITNIKKISYGVAVLITAALTWIVG